MLLKYAKRFRVGTQWLMEGSGEMEMTPDQIETAKIFDLMGKRAKNRSLIDTGRAGDVPQFNIHAGMGNGGLISVTVDESGQAINPEDSDGFWSFPDSVKSGMRNLRKIYAMPVTGDSMEPTILGGAIVFVDTSHTVPSPPDIYALDYGDGLMVKRVELVPQSEMMRIISDNERYREYELLRSEVHVYGRVIASFQWRG